MSIADLCNCETGVLSVQHDKCYSVDYGNRFIAALVQKPEGAPFDGTGGNSLIVAADVNAKVALPGTDPDKMAVIPRINLLFPPVAATLLAANESASGYPEMIEFEFTGNASLQYIAKATWTDIERLGFCEGALRVWLFTNTGWAFGHGSQTSADAQNGFEFMTMTHETPAFEGAGTKLRIPIHFHGIEKCFMKPIAQHDDFKRFTETGISV